MGAIYNTKALSGSHRHLQWDDAENFHYTLHVIRQHMQAHFSCDVLERFLSGSVAIMKSRNSGLGLLVTRVQWGEI